MAPQGDLGRRTLRAWKQADADGDHPIKEHAQAIQAACMTEIDRWCGGEEVRALHLLQSGAAGYELDAALLAVNKCLSSHANALSQPCLASLVGAFAQPGQDKLASVRGRDNHHHHGGTNGEPDHQPPQDSEDSWQPLTDRRHNDGPRLGADHRDDAKYYFMDNHGFGRGGDSTDQPRQIRSGDDRRGDHHHHKHHHDHEGFSLFAWLIILPFFALGVYVAAKRALTFYRQRRLAMTHHNVDARDYEPLNQDHSRRHHNEDDD